MKLPEDCPFAVMPASHFAPSGEECFECCRAQIHGWLLGTEEPLCRSQLTESDAYRFIWHSSFDGDAVVHIARHGDAIALRWRYLSFRVRVEGEAPPIVALSPADWGRLQDYLNAAKFWSLSPVGDAAGFDGAEWLIEGRRNDIYRAVLRWSPRGAIHDLGRMFFALSGPPLANVRLY